VRRTQLYLEEDIWQALRIRARQSGSTVSALVRQAVRETFVGSPKNRERVLRSVVGLWSDRGDLGSTEAYVRKLRKGSRLERLK
jgi:hypothetical protein